MQTKIIAPKKSLLNFVSIAAKYCKNNALPIVENILIQTDKESINLLATTLDNWIQETIPANVTGEACSFTVNAKELQSILKGVKGDLIELVYDSETELCDISFGGYKAQITTIDATDFPEIVELTDTRKLKFSGLFQLEMGKMLPFMGRDELRPVMSAVYLGARDGKIEMCATDAHRLRRTTFANVKEDFEPFELIFKDETVRIINSIDKAYKIGYMNCEIVFNGDFAIVNFGSVKVTCRLVDGKYPNFNAVIPTEKFKASFNRIDFIENLKIAAQFASRGTNRVAIEFKETKDLIIRTEDIDFGKMFSTSQPYEIASDEFEHIEIGFNINFMIELLSSIQDDFVTINFSEGNRPMFFESQTSLHLIMPVHVDRSEQIAKEVAEAEAQTEAPCEPQES